MFSYGGLPGSADSPARMYALTHARTHSRTCARAYNDVLWSDSKAEFTPVYNGIVRALLTPDDYNQQPFREIIPTEGSGGGVGVYARLFYFPFERCEPPRDRNHDAVCGYLRNCLTNTRGRASVTRSSARLIQVPDRSRCFPENERQTSDDISRATSRILNTNDPYDALVSISKRDGTRIYPDYRTREERAILIQQQ